MPKLKKTELPIPTECENCKYVDKATHRCNYNILNEVKGAKSIPLFLFEERVKDGKPYQVGIGQPCPKSRDEIIEEEIVRQNEKIRKIKGEWKPIADEKLPEIMQLSNERERALEYWQQSTNIQELKERAPIFIKAHKALLEAYGLKPCAAEDCTGWLTGRRQKYCSDSCKEKEKSRRARRRDPNVQRRAQLKYLKYLKKEGDLDPE